GAPRVPRGAPSVGRDRGAPRVPRGAPPSVGRDRGAPRVPRGAPPSVGRDRGALRVPRGAPSVGGFGGPFRGPPITIEPGHSARRMAARSGRSRSSMLRRADRGGPRRASRGTPDSARGRRQRARRQPIPGPLTWGAPTLPPKP